MSQSRLLATLCALACFSFGFADETAHISNNFVDTDIKVVLKEISATTGVTIIADSSVKGADVTMEFRDDSLENALTKLSLMTGFLWKKKGDIILVSMGNPESPMFNEFAVTQTYMPHTESAASLYSLLSRNYQGFVQTDKAANLLTITATQPTVDAIVRALDVIDKPRRQFIVEALVTEMNKDDSSKAGLSWNWKNFAQSLDSGLVYSQATSNDLVTLKALIDRKKATLKANPRISATEGKEASIMVGSETYYPMLSGYINSPSVQFQKVNTGIHLVVTGYIESDGMINLHLQPEVSDAAAPVGGAPTTTIRRADTYMRVRPGEAIALGGLTRELITREEQKVPILGDIPLLGSIFRSHEKVSKTTEVVIIIVPHLVETESMSSPMKTRKEPKHLLEVEIEKPKPKAPLLPATPAKNPPVETVLSPTDGLKTIK